MDAHKESTHLATLPSTLSWNIQTIALWLEIIKKLHVFVLVLLHKDRLILGLFNIFTTSIYSNNEGWVKSNFSLHKIILSLVVKSTKSSSLLIGTSISVLPHPQVFSTLSLDLFWRNQFSCRQFVAFFTSNPSTKNTSFWRDYDPCVWRSLWKLTCFCLIHSSLSTRGCNHFYQQHLLLILHSFRELRQDE